MADRNPAHDKLVRNHLIRAVLITMLAAALQRWSAERTKHLTGKLG